MSTKTKSGSVSDQPDQQTATALQTQTQTGTQVEAASNGDVSGPIHLALSESARDVLIQKFREKVHRVKTGFDTLTKPGDIFRQGAPFYVIDALTIEDYLDKRKGELLTKHVFQLEFSDGRVVNIMQADAGPRRELAELFITVRTLGASAKAGPYLFAEKQTQGQPQPAYIMVQQPGFEVVAV